LRTSIVTAESSGVIAESAFATGSSFPSGPKLIPIGALNPPLPKGTNVSIKAPVAPLKRKTVPVNGLTELT